MGLHTGSGLQTATGAGAGTGLHTGSTGLQTWGAGGQAGAGSQEPWTTGWERSSGGFESTAAAKPTWKIGADLHLAVGKVMKFDAMKTSSETGVSTGCGRCHDCAREVFDGAVTARGGCSTAALTALMAPAGLSAR